ncbi:MAG: PhoH family protein [Phycisphaerales bacterium]|nr:PhoH family protein [Phycisphaerales bacterium]
MEITIPMPPGQDSVGMTGSGERNLKLIREALGVAIAARGGAIQVRGEEPELGVARQVLEELGRRTRAGVGVSREEVLAMIAAESGRARQRFNQGRANGWDGRLRVYAAGQPVEPKTDNQRLYLDAIRNNDLTFGFGPAGTGKTYLAVAAAVHMLREGSVSRVILCRPAVEAGEKLGFLPGGLEEKVNPYLRPLLDALHDMMEYRDLRRFIESDVVEVVPLAFMRGRTLNGAVIILDEAQNTTKGQMKMFLTRMGHGSKMIVTGDTTQIDLPDPAESGLIDAVRRLRRVPGIGMVTLTGADVVRHKLVQRIVDAYGSSEDHRAYREAVAQAFGDDTEGPGVVSPAAGG